MLRSAGLKNIKRGGEKLPSYGTFQNLKNGTIHGESLPLKDSTYSISHNYLATEFSHEEST